jgi:threonine aldolase
MKTTLADFRSDTVTRPGPAMKHAMMAAELGDDVFGDDPTVIALEAHVAELAGKEAALFCPSGTQSNLVALLSHCQRGDEYIVGQEAHTYKYEGGGAAVLGSIQPQPIEFEPDSTLDLGKVRAKIKADDDHFARSRLLCLENTRSGQVLPLDYHESAAAFCSEHGLKLHLDGARLFNACIAQAVPLKTISQHYDSVSLCLSKGLGAPVGSLLAGSTELIGEARKWRKMLGGGMRQSGVLAAACLHALQHQVEDLREDHRRALELAEGLAGIDGLGVDMGAVQTNMVFLEMEDSSRDEALVAALAEEGIIWSTGPVKRLVTHRDIDDQGIRLTLELVSRFYSA